MYIYLCFTFKSESSLDCGLHSRENANSTPVEPSTRFSYFFEEQIRILPIPDGYKKNTMNQRPLKSCWFLLNWNCATRYTFFNWIETLCFCCLLCFIGLCCPNENHVLSFFDDMPSGAQPASFRHLTWPQKRQLKQQAVFFWGGADLAKFSIKMHQVLPRNVFHTMDFLLKYSPLIRSKAMVMC